jgi:hypothetical protein
VWEVEYTDQSEEWWLELDDRTQEDIGVAVSKLEERGPTLPRPFVDTIKGSKYPNMKELRPLRSNVRILFAFDPRRMAVLLIGGDKTGKWEEWYEEMIPVADQLYTEHLEELHQEGDLS